MKSISKKILLLISLLFTIGLVAYTDITLSPPSPTSGNQVQTFIINNIVSVPSITFQPVTADNTADPTNDYTNGYFHMGTFKKIGVKMTGRVRVNVKTSDATDYLGQVQTNSVSLKIDTPTLVLTNAASGKTITFNIGLAPNLIDNFSGITATQITASSSSAVVSSVVGTQGTQQFYAYIYFESQTAYVSGTLPDGVYASTGGITVSAIYN